MFTPPDNSSLEQNNQNQAQAEDFNIPEADIHTMPDKYLQGFGGGMPKAKGHLNWLILGLVIFLALGGVIVTVFLFLGKQAAPQITLDINSASNNANLNIDQVNANQNLNANQNTNTAQATDTPALRDQKRLRDMADLKSALVLYQKTFQVYPNDLNSLVGQFISQIPTNPQPGGLDYLYQASTDQLNYAIGFALEQGGDWGAVKLNAGSYVLTADGSMSPALPAGGNQNQNSNTNSLPTVPPTVATPTGGQDSDNDGLTDIEENVYHTSSDKADTDGDTYSDSAEILNHYDPIKANGRLFDSGLISIYQNSNYHYSMFYPASWAARSLTDTNSEVIFTSSTGEFMEVIVLPNALGQSSLNWYLSQNKDADPASLKSVTVGGLAAVQTSDGLNTYLAVGTNVFALTYNIGTQQQMNFYTTYKLLLNSFIFIPASNP